MENSNSKKGLVFLIVTAVVWGFACVGQVVGADSMTPFYFNFSRYFLGSLSVIPLIFIFERGAHDKEMMKTSLIAGLMAGVALFAASYVQQVGIMLTDSAGKGGFITGLYMIFVAHNRHIPRQKDGTANLGRRRLRHCRLVPALSRRLRAYSY